MCIRRVSIHTKPFSLNYSLRFGCGKVAEKKKEKFSKFNIDFSFFFSNTFFIIFCSPQPNQLQMSLQKFKNYSYNFTKIVP